MKNDNKEIARELAKIASNTAGNLFFGVIMVVVVFGVLLTGFELLLRLMVKRKWNWKFILAWTWILLVSYVIWFKMVPGAIEWLLK